jgi:hypothetical protein
MAARLAMRRYDCRSRTPCFLAKPIEALDGGIQQLGVGWEADRLGLHLGIDRDPRQVLGAQRAGGMRDPQGLGQQQLQLAAEPAAPMAQI